MTTSALPAADLQLVDLRVGADWDHLRNAHVLITGGTGFFGNWLTQSLLHANRSRALDLKLTIMSRSVQAFFNNRPHLAQEKSLSVLAGDVRELKALNHGFTHILHAATPAALSHSQSEPLDAANVIVKGMERILEASRHPDFKNLVFTSSGAVYGAQPSDMALVREDYEGGPSLSDARASYANAKRYAEHLCALHAAAYGIDIRIARCFAFVGPGLPLDSTFAVGNFIRDGLAGKPISVGGDGTPLRSYLHAVDLTVWLLVLLARPAIAGTYNVGSEQEVSIADLANKVGRLFEVPVHIAKKAQAGARAARYVPSVERAKALGLSQSMSLDEALERTVAWYRQ